MLRNALATTSSEGAVRRAWSNKDTRACNDTSLSCGQWGWLQRLRFRGDLSRLLSRRWPRTGSCRLAAACQAPGPIAARLEGVCVSVFAWVPRMTSKAWRLRLWSPAWADVRRCFVQPKVRRATGRRAATGRLASRARP
jgi:hypothetical protein